MVSFDGFGTSLAKSLKTAQQILQTLYVTGTRRADLIALTIYGGEPPAELVLIDIA